MIRLQKRLAVSALLTQFLIYFASVVIFSHTHYINGILVIHSHPYPISESSNNPAHQHTTDELLILQVTSETNFVASDFGIELDGQLLSKTLPIVLPQNELSDDNSFYDNGLYLRAPPVLS